MWPRRRLRSAPFWLSAQAMVRDLGFAELDQLTPAKSSRDIRLGQRSFKLVEGGRRAPDNRPAAWSRSMTQTKSCSRGPQPEPIGLRRLSIGPRNGTAMEWAIHCRLRLAFHFPARREGLNNGPASRHARGVCSRRLYARRGELPALPRDTTSANRPLPKISMGLTLDGLARRFAALNAEARCCRSSRGDRRMRADGPGGRTDKRRSAPFFEKENVMTYVDPGTLLSEIAKEHPEADEQALLVMLVNKLRELDDVQSG